MRYDPIRASVDMTCPAPAVRAMTMSRVALRICDAMRVGRHLIGVTEGDGLGAVGDTRLCRQVIARRRGTTIEMTGTLVGGLQYRLSGLTLSDAAGKAMLAVQRAQRRTRIVLPVALPDTVLSGCVGLDPARVASVLGIARFDVAITSTEALGDTHLLIVDDVMDEFRLAPKTETPDVRW